MLTQVKKLTHPKNFDPRKNIVDPRNSRTHAAHAAHAAHAPTLPRNPRNLAD